ncbi:transcription elongation factor S-II protein [Teladorsagia circumcincta]|uniref:Transcription elongation factor S-II protein n=1 Tax=Teladorsagia circumcincta TaxID=45464 RepID=A0A2G9U1A1_TELCI|nr:transcription elongation factor S-II protein [Teladorsagia circumcincta]
MTAPNGSSPHLRSGMTTDDVLLYKVIKYGKLIKKKERIPHVLSRLNDVEMTLDILSATNIGRYVNRLCDDPEYGREASRIIDKWKEVARQSGVRGGEEDGSSDGEEAMEHNPSPQRIGLLNGIHDIQARNRGGETTERQRHRDRSDYQHNDSEVRDRDRNRSKRDDDRKHHRSESTRDEGSSKKSRTDSHRRDEEHRRSHRGENERRRDSGEGSKPVQVDSHRHDDDYDRKRKRSEVEADNAGKRKRHDVARHVDSDGDDYSDSKRRDSGSGSDMAPARSSQERHEDNSDGQGQYGELSERTSEQHMEDVGNERGDSPPSERPTSSRGEKIRKKGPSAEECAPKSSKSSHNSSSSKTKSGKSTERNTAATDFEMVLQSADTAPSKSRKHRDPHPKWAEMPLLSNYQPFPQTFRAVKEAPPPPQDDFNPENMFKPRNERGKVFAGRRKVTAVSLPSLFNLCLRVLSNNIRVLYYAEYINYDVLKPILEKCNAETLAHIESRHHEEEPEDGDSWKDLYSHLEKEREKKLKQLSKRIGKHHQADSANAPRKVPDAAAPSYIRRRQIQNGTVITKALPSAIEVSSARRKIFETGGCKDALAALPKAVVNKNSTVGAKMDRGGAKKAPAKKGALMIKTMKMLNMKRK